MMLQGALIWYSALTIVTLVAFARDKAASARGGWRVRERTLLWLAAAGGFAGAILAVHLLNHKTRKISFRLIPWLAAVIHIAAWILIRKG